MEGYIISRKTAIASITALRHFNHKLQQEYHKYMKNMNVSSAESVMNFQKQVKDAYNELQKVTGDTTPLELRGEP